MKTTFILYGYLLGFLAFHSQAALFTLDIVSAEAANFDSGADDQTEISPPTASGSVSANLLDAAVSGNYTVVDNGDAGGQITFDSTFSFSGLALQLPQGMETTRLEFQVNVLTPMIYSFSGSGSIDSISDGSYDLTVSADLESVNTLYYREIESEESVSIPVSFQFDDTIQSISGSTAGSRTGVLPAGTYTVTHNVTMDGKGIATGVLTGSAAFNLTMTPVPEPQEIVAVTALALVGCALVLRRKVAA